MKYKAIIFDLDGTAIPNRRDGMPTERLKKAIERIQDRTYACAATGRPFSICGDILRYLNLKSPCIISAGTQIIDPVTEKILWEKTIPVDSANQALNLVAKYTTWSGLNVIKKVEGPLTHLSVEAVSAQEISGILENLNLIPDIVAHPVMSWTENHFDIHITHREADKEHAVRNLLEMLGLSKEEVVGFGDSNNDLPIFQGVGYKVAMANGTEMLKSAADEIAPHAEEDGVAVIIERLLAEGKIDGNNT